MALSKSKYLAFLQCPKRLWLETYKPGEAVVDESKKARFETGNIVGDLAMGYFGEFEEVTAYSEDGKLDIRQMIKNTDDCLKRGVTNICEASFSYNGTYCAVDILHRQSSKANNYAIYEVKSSTEGDHQVYIDDIACQAYVLKACGVSVTKYYTLVLDSDYIYDGKTNPDGTPKYNLKKLFKKTDLTDQVEERMACVARELECGEYVVKTKEELPSRLGIHCTQPYGCAFLSYCRKCNGVPEKDSVFDLYRVGKKAWEYIDRGIKSLEDVNPNEIESDKQKRQLDFAVNKRNDVFVDVNSIKSFLGNLKGTIYHLDFETMQPVLPLFKNSSPYEQIPFQYSLHIEHEDGKLEHKEYLAPSDGKDPRPALAEQLTKDIPEDVCVLAYNMQFEKDVIKRLADLYPGLKDHLMGIHSNIKDLIVPFQSGWCYNRAMGGSFSIKSVLPALFPNDPDLDYHNLQGSVHHGREAMTIFPKMKDMPAEEEALARESLLKYCQLDTYAMVRVLRKLKELVSIQPGNN